MTTRGHLTSFLFSHADSDYFVGLTDRNAVRIGLLGCTCYDIPYGHAYYDRICEASTAAEVESYHDELTSIFIPV